MPKPSYDDLINSLRYHAAWVEICKLFLSLRPETTFAALLEDMVEVEQSAIDFVARHLRQSDVPPAMIDRDTRLIRQARSLASEDARLRFVADGLNRSQTWYEERLVKPGAPHHGLWQALYEQQRELSRRHSGLLDLLSIPPRSD